MKVSNGRIHALRASHDRRGRADDETVGGETVNTLPGRAELLGIGGARSRGDQLQAAADIIKAGKRVAILCGQGALGAREKVTQFADTVCAPVAKALLGKVVLPDDSQFTTRIRPDELRD